MVSGDIGMNPLNFAILDFVAVPIFVLRPDAEGAPVYAFWNRAAERLGARPRHKVLGRTAVEVYDDTLGNAAYQRHIEVMSSRTAQTYDLVLDIDGAETEVQTTLSPILGHDGQVIAIVGTSVILTPIRAAQQKDIETLARVERARCEMEQYLAFAAHDLRAPMRRILGLSELIRDELPEDATEAREIANLMSEVSEKAQDLIGEVLDFSEASNAEARIESFELHLLCRDIFTVLDPRGLHDLHAEEIRLTADRTALQIILRNLVDNALKHAGKDRVHVRVCTGATPDGLDVLVEDDGKGLPGGTLDFLDGKPFEYGHGFGLLGLRRLLGMRKGRLSATQAKGGGSLVRVHLPGTRRADE